MFFSLAHFISLIKQEENEPNTFKGCPCKDLLKWYLEEISTELTTIEIFDAKKKTIGQVIRRMIKHDNSIIIVGENDVGVSSEDKLLRLNPNQLDFEPFQPAY